jgi:hypothetical protein
VFRTTKSAIANGTVEVKSNPNQDISNLSRDTSGALNELGKIFDKETVQEKQELAKVFGEEAYEEVHKISVANGWDEGSPQKIALHALVGGIMSDLGGSSFTSGAVGAGVNEAIQKQLSKITDPDLHQWASVIVGAAAAKTVGGSAQAGASTAASGTKNNMFWIPAAVSALGDAIPLIAGYYIVCTDEGKKIVNETGKVLAAAVAEGGFVDSYGNYLGDKWDDFVYWASNGSPRNNQAQNRQTKAAAKKYGLNKEQEETLHKEVSGQNYGYKEIEEIAERIANKEIY